MKSIPKEELLERLESDIKLLKSYHPFILYEKFGLDGKKIAKDLNKIIKNIKNNKTSKVLNEDMIDDEV